MKSVSAVIFSALGLFAFAQHARAETVGVASEVVRTVLESTGETFSPLAEGDALFRDQRIRSGQDGSALLTLEDASVVAVGPSSEVVLDAFVAPGGVRGVSVARGVFRFISGPAGSGTHYVVKTPHASIAVRGTRFDVRVLGGMTTVVLDEGAVDVCVGATCRSMTPGTSVDVTRAGIYPAVTGGMLRWTFITGAGAAQRRVAEHAAAEASRARAASAAAFVDRTIPGGGSGAGGSRGSSDGVTTGASSSAGIQAGTGETTSAVVSAGPAAPASDSPAVAPDSMQAKASSASGGLSVKMKMQ